MSDQVLIHVPAASGQAQGHQTALHRAAMVGNSDAIAALVQGGCATDLQDRDGNTALHEVAWHGFCQCVKLLVKGGADVHVRNKAGNTALHLACQNAHAQSARVLLLGGSRPDTKNNVGDTCLHVAARYNHLAIVKILLGALCSVTEKNQLGDTALHVAAALNHKKTVQLLLEAGTDGNAKNNAGKTALDRARDNNHRDVALLLARAPQVHRFMRGRTVRKRRERLKAERKTQSVTRVDILPNKESGSVAEDTPSSDQVVTGTPVIKTDLHQDHHHRRHHKTQPTTTGSPHSRRRRRKLRELALDEDSPRRGENGHSESHRKNRLFSYDEVPLPQNDKAYQLFSLYRDKDGNIRQAPADGCHCEPLIRKLEGQLRATQEEMSAQILSVQEQLNDRLGKMDRRNRHQIKVLDILTQERVAAERMDLLYKIDQRAAQSREEADRRQAAVSRDLKKWCMTQMQDLDLHIPADPQYYKLLPSPSVDQSLTDGDPESLPLLSVVSGESSSSLATYVNLLPCPASRDAIDPGQERATASRKYLEVKVDRSPDDYENTAIFPLPCSNHSSGLVVSSADPRWPPAALQDSAVAAAAVVGLSGEGWGSGSVSSSQSDGSDWEPRSGHRYSYRSWHHRRYLLERFRAHRGGPAGGPGDGTRTLEFFIDRPPEPTFSQERNNLHAVEVTQCFFETVSAQLERWYERKILEAKRDTAVRTQRDKEQLLQRITSLEEELQRLRTNGNAES